MDAESWYSATPEPIARQIAEHFESHGITSIIVDAFCGCGFNAIQFAQICEKGAVGTYLCKINVKVIAVDIDPVKIKCAKHNAKIYGVSNIIFVTMNFFDYLLPSLSSKDGIFMSPPWGGKVVNLKFGFDF